MNNTRVVMLSTALMVINIASAQAQPTEKQMESMLKNKIESRIWAFVASAKPWPVEADAWTATPMADPPKELKGWLIEVINDPMRTTVSDQQAYLACLSEELRNSTSCTSGDFRKFLKEEAKTDAVIGYVTRMIESLPDGWSDQGIGPAIVRWSTGTSQATRPPNNDTPVVVGFVFSQINGSLIKEETPAKTYGEDILGGIVSVPSAARSVSSLGIN